MRTALAICLAVLLAGCITTPSETISEPLGPVGMKWSKIEESPDMVAFFRGTFEVLNFTVKETGERFYLVFGTDKVSVLGGRHGGADLDVSITQAQADSVSRLAVDGKFDAQDSFAVLQILYGPISRAFLTGSFLNNEAIRRLAGVESVIHITFWSPNRPETSSVTLMAEGNHWTVLDGLVGKPERVFRLNEAETLDYMRHVHKTRKSANPKVWLDFARWYAEWRDRVSTVPGAAQSRTSKTSGDRTARTSQCVDSFRSIQLKTSRVRVFS